MSLFNKSKNTPNAENTEAKNAETENRLTKITIESPKGDSTTLEVHGAAMATVKGIGGNKYQGGIVMVGLMSLKELTELYKQVKYMLVSDLEGAIAEHAEEAADAYSLKDLMEALDKALDKALGNLTEEE